MFKNLHRHVPLKLGGGIDEEGKQSNRYLNQNLWNYRINRIQQIP